MSSITLTTADGFVGKAEGPACRSKRDLPFLHYPVRPSD